MSISKMVAVCVAAVCSVWGTTVDDSLLKLLDMMEVKHEGTLASIVAETQKQWIRPAGKERWQVEGDFSADAKAEIFPLASKLGFIEELKPAAKKYDYCLLLGATVGRMEKRINYFVKMWNEGVRFSQIVFFTGARSLDPTVDRLTTVCKTETEAAHYLWDHAELPEGMKKMRITFVDVPMISTKEGLRRPTTEDTVGAWLAANPRPGNCLAISNQPYCLYQGAVLQTYLPEEFSCEVVGERANLDCLNGRVLLDTIARWLYQLNLQR
jgi:hypothetical protein